jgi:hypothetical protein
LPSSAVLEPSAELAPLLLSALLLLLLLLLQLPCFYPPV